MCVSVFLTPEAKAKVVYRMAPPGVPWGVVCRQTILLPPWWIQDVDVDIDVDIDIDIERP